MLQFPTEAFFATTPLLAISLPDSPPAGPPGVFRDPLTPGNRSFSEWITAVRITLVPIWRREKLGLSPAESDANGSFLSCSVAAEVVARQRPHQRPLQDGK